MKLRLLPLSLLIAALLGACGSSDPVAPDNTTSSAPAAAQSGTQSDSAATAARLEQLYNDFWEASLKLNPVQATFVGDSRYNDQLPNFLSAEFRQQWHYFEQSWLDQISAIDASTLEGQARLSYDIFVRERRLNLEGERFPGWMQPVNQFRNFSQFFVQLGSGASAQPFVTVKDYDNWFARASVAPAIFDTAIANIAIQAITSGELTDLDQARELIARSFPMKTYEPEGFFWREAQGRFPQLMGTDD